MLGFRRNVDIVKSFKGAYPSQPKANGEDQQEQTDDQRQAHRMRRIRVQSGAINDANAGSKD